MDANQARAAGFGAGMGVLQRTCGAVTGGIMVLGCMYFDDRDPAGSKIRVYEKIRALIRHIEQLHDSVECFELLGADIKTEKGYALARETNLFHFKCKPVLLSVCGFLDGMIDSTAIRD
jgi:C_GCAxxG_C_C family probable redox protein